MSEIIKTARTARRVRVEHNTPVAHDLPVLEAAVSHARVTARPVDAITENCPADQRVEESTFAPKGVVPHAALDEAFRKGYREGLAASETRAQEIAAARLAADKESRGTLVASLQRQLDLLAERNERDVLRAALAIAGRILRREIQLDEEVILRHVREALHRVVGAESITLRIHPLDESLVREHRSSLLGAADSVRELLLETDEKIERGGCILESRSGNIDARIATALAQIDRVLAVPPAVTDTNP